MSPPEFHVTTDKAPAYHEKNIACGTVVADMEVVGALVNGDGVTRIAMHPRRTAGDGFREESSRVLCVQFCTPRGAQPCQDELRHQGIAAVRSVGDAGSRVCVRTSGRGTASVCEAPTAPGVRRVNRGLVSCWGLVIPRRRVPERHRC